MLNFNQLFNLVNGEPYETTPAPTSYNFSDYAKELTSSPVGGTEDGVWALTPLKDEDMATTSAKDVVDNLYQMKKNGFNPTRLGPPMTDAELQKFCGMG